MMSLDFIDGLQNARMVEFLDTDTRNEMIKKYMNKKGFIYATHLDGKYRLYFTSLEKTAIFATSAIKMTSESYHNDDKQFLVFTKNSKYRFKLI